MKKVCCFVHLKEKTGQAMNGHSVTKRWMLRTIIEKFEEQTEETINKCSEDLK